MGGRRALVAVAVAAALSGCSSAGVNGEATGSPAPRGLRVHRLDPGVGMDAIVAGVVEVDPDSGCIWLSDPDGARYPVVWPAGTSARSDPFAITLADGQLARAGDRVQGGGGYVDAGSAARELRLPPFPPECVHVGDAAVFNAGSPISVTAGVGSEPAETLEARFSPPEPIGLELLAVNANARSVAVIDFVTGTVHRYGPRSYEGPPDAIDGAGGGGGFTHLWSQGTIYSYDGRPDSEPLVYQPDPLLRAAGIASTLQVLPAPDGERTWLVQTGTGDDPTLIELINLVEVQVTRLVSTEIEGSWRPVGATIEGVVLVTDDPQPTTSLVAPDGTVEAELPGTALSVGWNGAAVVRPDGSLVVTDARLSSPMQVDKPGEGAWVPVGGPMVPATSPPVRTGTDRFLVMLAHQPDRGPLSAGELVVVDGAGRAAPIYELSHGSHLASWSRGADWVVVVEDSSVTLISLDGRSAVPLGDLVPDSHWVLSAG